MNILIIGTVPTSIIRFRGNLIKDLVSRGHQVFAACSQASQKEILQIEGLGAKHLNYFVNRTTINPISDIFTIINLLKLIRSSNPDCIMAYTIKPVIYSGLITRLFKIKYFFPLITGLGFSMQNESIFQKFLSSFITFLYRFSLRNASKIIFQNIDNLDSFIADNIIPRNKAKLVNGSGVDLRVFQTKPLPKNPRFLMIARLLKDKGVKEYIDAAKKIKKFHPCAQFDLVGPPDSSPNAINPDEVLKWHSRGVINYYGFVDDVRPFIEKCSIFVLPSYHEGMPNTVLEAMAMGRPILTTNVPGCKETVIEGVNGYLVRKANLDDLVNKMIWFIKNPTSWDEMGLSSRAIVEKKFDVEIINKSMSEIILDKEG